MTPDQKFERRRHFIIAIPTGILAACMVFVVMGLVNAAKDDLRWVMVILLILPLLIVLCRTSATHLQAALHPDEEWGPPEEINPPKDDDPAN